MFLTSHQLNQQQYEALRALKKRCAYIDSGLPTIYPHILKQRRDIASTILALEEDKLIGFLSVYFFYPDACEISLLIDPDYRRQGLASQLLLKIIPLLKTKNIKKLIFSMTASLNEGWLKKLGFDYQQTDYRMVRKSFEPILNHELPDITFRKADKEDIPTLCRLDDAAFLTNSPQSMEMFQNLLKDAEYTIYVAIKNHELIGKAHVRWQTDKTLFSDIAILPEFQGQGYGSALLTHCINQALLQGKSYLALDVETTNISALNIYLRHDFKINSVHEYWSISIEKIQELLNQKTIIKNSLPNYRNSA